MRSVSEKRRRRVEVECDGLWQELQSAIWLGRCGACGVFSESNTGHHIARRGIKEHRHEMYNGILLCGDGINCHARAHANPVGFIEYLRDRRPWLFDWYEVHRADKPQRISVVMLKGTRTRLRAEIVEVKALHLKGRRSRVISPKWGGPGCRP
jgi:hypothetical protein